MWGNPWGEPQARARKLYGKGSSGHSEGNRLKRERTKPALNTLRAGAKRSPAPQQQPELSTGAASASVATLDSHASAARATAQLQAAQNAHADASAGAPPPCIARSPQPQRRTRQTPLSWAAPRGQKVGCARPTCGGVADVQRGGKCLGLAETIPWPPWHFFFPVRKGSARPLGAKGTAERPLRRLTTFFIPNSVGSYLQIRSYPTENTGTHQPSVVKL
jgi:hypothetical protein